MSGIYIPGMEMPENCYGCPIAQGYNRPAYCGLNGSIPKLWKEFDDALEKEIKPDFCPLIAVPDHGRLIDADALIDDLKRQCKEVFRIDAVLPEDFWINRNEAYRQRLYESWCEGFYEYVGSRPTIIPADKDGDA